MPTYSAEDSINYFRHFTLLLCSISIILMVYQIWGQNMAQINNSMYQFDQDLMIKVLFKILYFLELVQISFLQFELENMWLLKPQNPISKPILVSIKSHADDYEMRNVSLLDG